MTKFTTPIYQDLQEEITQIALQAENVLQRAEQSYEAVKRAIQKINDQVLSYTFNDVSDEIYFFKVTKPNFLKELIFYNEIYYIEAHCPVGNTDSLRQYYHHVMEGMRTYFQRNEALYNYYRTNKTVNDAFFFTRNQVNELSAVENEVEIDHRCCTVHSKKLAKLLAFELVIDYLQNAMYKLDNPEWVSGQNPHQFKNLWTDSKAALIELAYAIYAKGSVNNGKGELRQIITDLEIMFNVQLGNYYRTFQKLRFRKKNPTPYIDGLKFSLVEKMEEDL